MDKVNQDSQTCHSAAGLKSETIWSEENQEKADAQKKMPQSLCAYNAFYIYTHIPQQKPILLN